MVRRSPGDYGIDESSLEEIAGRRAGGERGDRASRSSRVSPARPPTSRCSTPGAAIYVGGAGGRSRRAASTGAREAIDSGAAADVLRKLIEMRDADRDG